VLLLAVIYVWVVRSQVSFEEASIDRARRRAERLAAMSEGKWGVPVKPRSEPFRLAPQGFIPIAFLWKGLISIGSFWRLRTWLIACTIVIVGGDWLAADPDRKRVLAVVGIFSALGGAWYLVLVPMFTQRGLRQMLDQLDILKASPLRGWQIALGELLCPMVVMTFALWLLLVIVEVSLGSQADNDPMIAATLPIGALSMIHIGTMGMALAAPPLCGLMLCAPFAGILYFPAWTASSGSRSGDFEVMGQRMIFMGGYLVTLVLTLVPAVALGGLAFLVLRSLAGASVALLVAAVTASATLAAELAAAVDWLGRRIDRFDMSQELPRQTGQP